MSATTRCIVLLAMLAGGAPTATALALPVAPDAVPHRLPVAGGGRTARNRGGWIVGARPGAAGARIARAHGAQALRVPGTYVVRAGRARTLARALRRHGLLRFSEPDGRLRSLAAPQGPGGDGGWARDAVVAPGLSFPVPGAPIGFVDQLVDASVPDTAQATIVKGSPRRTPTGAHGTEVASVAAGRGDGAGVEGIEPAAPILTYGLVDQSCTGVADGIAAMVDAGARIVNLSLGTTEPCFLLQLAISDAVASGALIVAAAGNEFRHGNPIVYPAAYPHVLSVGALDETLAPSGFSTANAALDVAAPGVHVPVAVPLAADVTDGADDGVSTADGTSFAAPIVSGVASWVMAVRPRLTAGQVADLLRHSARDLGAPGWDASTGYGLVDLAAALHAPTPPIDPLEPNDGISLVNGRSYTKPDPYLWRGGRPRTLRASVDAVEDPVDVYRIRLGAGRRASVTLTPTAGHADLALYDAAASGIDARPLARSRGGVGRTDAVRVTNPSDRPRTYFVAVLAPKAGTRAFDAPYVLRIARTR